MKNQEMARMLRWIAAVVIVVGIVCSAVNLTQFSDSNLGLMLGLGFLIGGGQILLFGVLVPLMQKHDRGAAPTIADETVS